MNDNIENRFNTTSYWIMMINMMVEQLCSLMYETVKSDTLVLTNERGAKLLICDMNRGLGNPTRYTMENYMAFNKIDDMNKFLSHVESFNLSEVVNRITTLVGSATFDKFLSEFHILRRESVDKELSVSSIIFTYLSGGLAFHHIPVTKEGIKWLKLVIDQDLNGTETLDSYIDQYADKEYLYGENREYDPGDAKNDGMYYGVFVDPNSKVSIDGNVLNEFEDYQEFRNYVLDKASMYYGRMKAYKAIDAFVDDIIQNNCPTTSNVYSAKACFFRMVLENLIEYSPMKKALYSLLKSAAMVTNIDEIICLATDDTLKILETYEDGHASLELYKMITHIDTCLTDSAFEILNHIDVEAFNAKIEWIRRTGNIEDMIRETYFMAARIRDYVQRNSLIGDSATVESSFESLSNAVNSDPDLSVFLTTMKITMQDIIKGILNFEIFNLFFDSEDRRIPVNNFRFAVAMQDANYFLRLVMDKLDVMKTTEMVRRRYDQV